ncbi:hypothetical protein [Chryseobacterium sp. NFX27]|uniref:hypothetical protein n=1 Tax=Chryseobacterium sp. NFX27 TaxID=2819618 RepID=UPI003CE6D101
MKKYLLMWAVLLISADNYYSQLGIGNGGMVTSPIASPSMSSMSTYSDIPVSLASGLPEINIPLLNVPLTDKGIGYPFNLSYNLNNLLESETAGDVGAGWSFFGTSVIYKKIVDEVDECYFNNSSNEYNDIYYYNFPGASGKFRIKRDVTNNTFSLINLTPDHSKIEYIRDNTDTNTFRAESFSITTDNGYKYIFNEFDYSRTTCGYTDGATYRFKSAYFLTKILSPLNTEVASLEYEKKNEVSGGYIMYQYCKLKSVATPSGKVVLDYIYNDALKETVNDPYSLEKITMKNPAGQTVYSYDLNYSIADFPAKASERKRLLNYIRKNDKNGQRVEQTSFVYSDSQMLKRIISPTGGVTEYNYEANEKFFNYNDPNYLQGLEEYSYNPDFQISSNVASLAVNSSQSMSYNFTIPGDSNKKQYFRGELKITHQYPPKDDDDFPDLPGLPDLNVANTTPPKRLKMKLKRGSEVIFDNMIVNGNYLQEFSFSSKPGDYTVEFISIEGLNGTGTINILGAMLRPGPFRNSMPATGYRIKNTKFYKNSSDTNAERTINYGYDSTDMVNSTSGYEFYNEADTGQYSNSSYIIYNSVKVSETGKGYIKNRFKTANDYPKYQTGGTQLEPVYFWPYYRITKQGLPFKREIYDEQNNLLSSEESEYELDYYSTDEYAVNAPGGKFSSKPAYVKKTLNKSTVYYKDGKKLENSSETHIEGNAFKPVYTKSIVDGEVSERFMTYPVNLPGYSQLETAYMTGSPVIVEEKQSGKTLSKATTKYNASSLLPSSIISTNIHDGSVKEHMKMDLYDDKGNLLQVTNAVGFPTAFVYGYHKTQLIAKVEGATYAQISSLVSAIVTASDNDNLNGSTEPALLLALDNFKKNPALAGYLVTTYTYDPLIGLTSMTSPSGMREIYEYDDAGRLKVTKRMDKDNSGTSVPKKIKEYQYNYKQ